MGMNSLTDKQLHLDGHDQVNVTWGLVVHIELALWIAVTVCMINQIKLSALIHSFISINVNLKKRKIHFTSNINTLKNQTTLIYR